LTVLEVTSIINSATIDAVEIPSIIIIERNAQPKSRIFPFPKLYPYSALQPLQTVACGKISFPQKGQFFAMRMPLFKFHEPNY
jgi:hypothetical protein